MLSQTLHEALQELYKTEVKKLDSIYNANSISEIKTKEHDALISMSSELMLNIEWVIRDVLKKASISYIETVWRRISEQTSAVSYKYIDWDSLKSPESYQVNEAEASRRATTDSFVIMGTSLTVGTIAATALVISGHPVIALVAVGSAVLGGNTIRILRSLRSEKVPQKNSVNVPTSINTENLPNEAVKTAHEENKKNLADWFSKIEEVTLAEASKI